MKQEALTATSINGVPVIKTQPLEGAIERKKSYTKAYRKTENAEDIKICLSCDKKKCCGTKECFDSRRKKMECERNESQCCG